MVFSTMRVWVLVGIGLAGGPAFGDAARHLGAIADVIGSQLTKEFSAEDSGDWFVVSTSVDEAEQSFLLDLGTPPAAGRTTTLNATILPGDDTAAVGFFYSNDANDAICVMEMTAKGDGNFFCSQGEQRQQIGNARGIAKLDGSDILAVVEAPGIAEFYVNDTYIGTVENNPALNSKMGLLFYDRATFGVTSFEMTGGETSNADPDLVSIMGSLAEAVATATPQDGWRVFTQDGWLGLENLATADSSYGLAPPIGAPDAGGRATSTYVSMSTPSGMSAADIANSSVGLMMQGVDEGEICSGEIAGSGDAVMSCWANGNGREIGRLKGIAKFDGTDVISLLEWPGVAQFWANNQMIGEVKNSAAQGNYVGIIAYGIGNYWYAGYNTISLSDGGKGTGTTGDTGTVTTASAQGDGPLPMFDGDSGRITGTYLGVISGVFLHEFGHALIGELKLPSTGPEEDAVDIFSALRISAPEALDGPDENAKSINKMMATYATLQWFYSGMVAEQQGMEDVPWQDEHTADLKRFRNTFCVIYGSNPSYFSELATTVQMDERTLSRCNDEFVKQNRAWRSILAPYTRVSEWYPDGTQRPDAEGAKISVVFEPSTRQVGNMVKAIMGDSGTFQEWVDGLARDYVLPRDINVTFKDCGELNAWYSGNDGTITMCYDFVEYVIVMISDVEMGTSGGYPVSGSATPVANSEQGAGAQPVTLASSTFNELEDYGIPQTWALFSAPYNGPTPISNPAANVVTTDQLAGILQDQAARYVLIDTRGQGQTLPQALVEREAARDGALTDSFQSVVSEWLTGQTGGQSDTYLIFFGNGPDDRSAYNAALRAGATGQFSNVLWYRGGEAAWVANGLPLYDAPQ